jgi:FlaA1/EpsC-like NDP-sugar epimerase
MAAVRKFDRKKITRTFLLVVFDSILINLSLYISYLLRFEGNIPEIYWIVYVKTFIIAILIKIIVFYFSGLYTSLWRYASIDELINVALAVFMGSVMVFVANYIGYETIFKGLNAIVPRSIYIISASLDLIFIGGFRLSYRIIRQVKKRDILHMQRRKRALIYGAGDAGAMVIIELMSDANSEFEPVAIIDDDTYKHRKRIHGIPVVGGKEVLKRTVINKKIDEIILAIPSLSKTARQEIIKICDETGAKIKTLPRVNDIISGKVTINDIRPVEIEDLLGREPVELDLDSISKYIQGKVILVTGGGGSIGSELCRQIASYEPAELIILDIYENNAYEIQNELLRQYDHLMLQVVIASVRDEKRINEIFRHYKPHVVFHAAAHKHVPLMELNPEEAIKNNIFGGMNVIKACHTYGVNRFVLISTDKAVNPTNIMGATKRFCEMAVQAYSKGSKTEFVAVRFGNVLGSNGSVIPLFKNQIKSGGPVTVTDRDIIRYFMTIPEAAALVVQAGGLAKGGEIFVLDMGEPVKIDNLARDLIRLSGFEPNKDIEIVYTGLRPGEKLYEELLMTEEGLENTSIEKIFIGKPIDMTVEAIDKMVLELKEAVDNGADVKALLQTFIPTYQRL